MCAPMCGGFRPSYSSARWSLAGSSPAVAQAIPSSWPPGEWPQADLAPSSAMLPNSHCPGLGLLPGTGEQGSLLHLGLEGRHGVGGLERGSGEATQRDHLSFVSPAPLPPPFPLRLRVHRSGDPWELEANFPRSLVMERPQVLPLIKVKCGAEEKL